MSRPAELALLAIVVSEEFDIVIIGSGPNGLSAGVALAQQGLEVLMVEGANQLGGGTRTAELTLPGFHHDICSAVHPMGYLSPFLKTLPLQDHGLEWIIPKASVAHPLDDQDAVILSKSVEDTAANLGLSAQEYGGKLAAFIKKHEALLDDSFGPLGLPKNPLLLARFGLKAFQPATFYARHALNNERERAMFAGCTAHSVLPFNKFFTSAMGLMFMITAHVENWAIAKGGSQSIANAMAGYFESLGGKTQTGWKVRTLEELPRAKRYLFDTDPRQLARIAANQLPKAYVRKLNKFNYGPGVFKIDYALDGPIPWKDIRCLEASTVHVGGTFAEVAQSEKEAWTGKHSERPFVLLAQQSQFDSSRAPEGKHTGWAYCHVPQGSEKDMTEQIENQIERFAPGFKDRVLLRHKMNCQDFQNHNPNYVGGAVTGGATDITQLFTRPVARLDPYSTPDPKIFICSSSTPPGGGVHGMCGYHAAQSVLKSLGMPGSK